MASAGVIRCLDQAPVSISPGLPHQRASLKRPRPYLDEERPLPPRRPRAAGPSLRNNDGDGEEEEEEEEEEEGEGEGEGERGSEDEIEGGELDGGDDDSDFEENVEASDGDEEALVVATTRRKQQQQRRAPLLATAAAAEPANTTEDESVAPDNNGSSGEAPEYPPPQWQQKLNAGGGSSHAGTGGRGGGGGGGGRSKRHECQVCGKVFGKACKLARHAATHTGEKPFLCEEDGCSKAFATKDKLRRHALSHARRKAGLSVSVGSAARREAEVRQRAALFEADAAAAGVLLEPPAEPSPFLLYSAKAKAGVPPLVAASRMERERAAAVGGGGGGGGGGSGSGTAAAGGGWKHSCPTCGRNFLDNYHLKRHIKAIHEGPRPYKCDHPVALAATPTPAPAPTPAAGAPAVATRAGVGSGAENVQQREVAADVGEGKAVEGEDGKEVGGAGAGATAGGGVMGGPQQKAYGVCGAAFAKKWQLREHLHSEHGQTKFNSRQHRCSHPGCGREFDRPSKLAAHEKTHEARFVCQFSGCGAAFVLASGLNLHLKEEHPFRCGVCDKIFDREDKMLIHQGTHARAGDGDFIRPYTCNFRGCGKSFTEKRNLNAHRRTRHTEGGRKRFRCEVGDCAMSFAHRHTLVKHIKREHQGSSPSRASGDSGHTKATKARREVEHDKRKRQGAAKASSETPPHRRHEPRMAPAAPAATNPGAADARSLGEAWRDTEHPAE